MQKAKQEVYQTSTIVTGESGTIFGEPNGNQIVSAGVKRNVNGSTKRAGFISQYMLTSHYPTYNKKECLGVITTYIEMNLAYYQPIHIFGDLIVQSFVANTYSPMVLKYLPKTAETMFKQFIVLIDNLSQEKLIQHIKSALGTASLEVDGVIFLKNTQFQRVTLPIL